MRLNRGPIAAVAAVAAMALAVPALAQDDGGGTETETTTEPARDAERHQRLAQALAEELGLTVDEVQDALDAVHERLRTEREAARLEALQDRLAAAVEGGDLTQDQADAILEAFEAGVLPHPGRHQRRHRGAAAT